MTKFFKFCVVVVAPLIVLLTGARDVRCETEPQAREIKVIARRFEFVPKTVNVRKGERIRLLITSEDVDHGVDIPEFNIDQEIKAKQTKAIEFTARREGRFQMLCSVFCGDGHPNMVGTIVVTGEQSPGASNIKVTFDENTPGVVFVESNGERIRIDTSARTVASLDNVQQAPAQAQDQLAATTPDSSTSRTREPYDYHIVNVPTPKRVPKHSLNVYFTHRFEQPIKPLRNSDDDLFGLDSSSVSSLGVTYGITDRLYFNFYRSPLQYFAIRKTIEMGFGYHLLDEAGRSPVALSAYASIEGENNFKRNYTYNFQAMIGRSITRYANVFFSPAAHINTNGQSRFNPPVDIFGQVAEDFRLGQHTGSFGFGVNGRIRRDLSLLFEYTPRVGFKLGQVSAVIENGEIVGFENKSEAEIGFGIEKRIGRHVFSLTFSNTQTSTTSRYNSSNLVLPPKKFTIGFNLFRRLL